MFIQIEPQNIKIPCESENSLLQALQKNAIKIASICGGSGTCGKCKVKIIDGKVSEPTAEELRILSKYDLSKGIRLACQSYPMGSVILNIVEPANEAQYKTMLKISYGVDNIDPNVKKIYLQLPSPSLEDQRADAERLLDVLKHKDLCVRGIDPHILPLLPVTLRKSDWKITATLIGDIVTDVEESDTTSANYGVAFDLGTTTVAAYLLDINSGRLLDQAAITNRQGAFGEDVMTRIDQAHNGKLKELQAAAAGSLNRLIDMLTSSTRVPGKNIYEAVVVGNTCMNHLLLGIDPYCAGVAPFTPAINTAPDVPASFLGIKIAGRGTVHLPPVISGFVGADTVGDALALDFDRKQPPHLMIDIGTNAEMALSVEGRVMACSAAAGPAFEGARISCGMRAAPGAIDRVIIKNHSLECHTIDNKPAVGIAGSGLISVAAALKRAGLMTKRGALRKQAIPAEMLDENNMGIILAPAEKTESGKPLILTWRDLGEELVIARAAIRTGIQVLLKEADIDINDLARISIAGAFGNFLDINDAVEIGLLPDIALSKISGVGNAAGKGAILMLLSCNERQRAKNLAQNIKYVELSAYPDFNRMFSANMKL